MSKITPQLGGGGTGGSGIRYDVVNNGDWLFINVNNGAGSPGAGFFLDVTDSSAMEFRDAGGGISFRETGNGGLLLESDGTGGVLIVQEPTGDGGLIIKDGSPTVGLQLTEENISGILIQDTNGTGGITLTETAAGVITLNLGTGGLVIATLPTSDPSIANEIYNLGGYLVSSGTSPTIDGGSA